MIQEKTYITSNIRYRSKITIIIIIDQITILKLYYIMYL